MTPWPYQAGHFRRDALRAPVNLSRQALGERPTKTISQAKSWMSFKMSQKGSIPFWLFFGSCSQVVEEVFPELACAHARLHEHVDHPLALGGAHAAHFVCHALLKRLGIQT